jgi:phosphoglycerate dehydrogenase-like enzyme
MTNRARGIIKSIHSKEQKVFCDLMIEAALLDALGNRRISRAAIDVYDVEPLPQDHPYRRVENLLATPHIGYVTRGLYERFYRDTVANISAWLDSR